MDAPPIWSPNYSPTTIAVRLADPGALIVFPIPVECLTHILQHPNGLVVVMGDERGRQYLWTDDPHALQRPEAAMPFDDVTPLRQAVAMRLWHWCTSGRTLPLPSRLRLTPLRLRLLIQQLHALDYYQSGVMPRDIAIRMLDRNAGRLRAVDWKSSAIRRQVNRLLEEAKELMNGGYRDLLRGH